MYRLAGNAHSFLVQFRNRGEPAIPDQGSVTYTLRGHDGALLAGHAAVPVETGALAVETVITVPADQNLIAGSLERRSITVNWTFKSAPKETRLSYWLHAWLNFSTTPADVRKYIGANESELPDDDIDLVEAYIEVAKMVTVEALVSKLQTDPLQAENALLAYAVLSVIPSLKSRMAQEQADGVLSFTRPDLRNFDELRVEARSMLDNFVLNTAGQSLGDTPLLAFGTRPDVITGT